ncbi:MAG: bacillithiol biosynthesis cysteine-adding enzyme BshC [Meiothermus sp.]
MPTTPEGLGPYLPHGLEDLPRLLERPRTAPRAELSAGLVAYLSRIGAPSASLAAARRLAEPHSRAIVTGQQAGLLTGPAYTFYKAHSALALARQHDSPDRAVVAVFWVASQDHDTDEVRYVRMLDGDERVHTLALELPRSRPAGRIPFGPYLEQVCAFLGGFGGIPSIQGRICRTMVGDWSYSEVFARLLLEFLGPEGLVVLDPMAPELAPLFIPPLEREIAVPLASAEAINQTAARMRADGLEVALGRGEAATNLFLEGQDGVRRLLRFRQGHFEDGQRRYTPADLLAILHGEPSRLTPAAGLRPVLQDVVLPTAGFVVGPGELRYVAELGGVYRLHGLEPPAVIRRMGATVLEPPIQRILRRYGLDPWAFQANPEERFLQALAQQHELARGLEASLGEIIAKFAEAQNSLARFEPTLERSCRRAQKRVTHELERLRHKLLQAELRKEGVVRAQFERLRLHLAPDGVPQERVYPFPMYLLKHGEAVLERLRQAPAVGNVGLEV